MLVGSRERRALLRWVLTSLILIAATTVAFYLMQKPTEPAPVTWLTADGQPPAGMPDIEPLSELSLGSDAGTVAWSPDGRYLATSEYYDMIVRIWDTRNWRQLHKIRKKTAGANRMIFMPDSRTLIVSSIQIGDDRSALTLIDAPSGEIVRHVDGPNGIVESEGWPMANMPRGFDLSADGSMLFLNAWARKNEDRGIYVYDTTSWAVVSKIHPKWGAIQIAAAPESDKLASIDAKGSLHVWRVPDGTLIKRFPTVSQKLYAVAVDPVSGDVLVGYSPQRASKSSLADARTLCLWSKGGDLISSARTPGTVTTVAISRGLVVADIANRAVLFSGESMSEVATLKDFDASLVAVEFSKDGERLAVAGDNKVLIYSIAATGRLNGASN